MVPLPKECAVESTTRSGGGGGTGGTAFGRFFTDSLDISRRVMGGRGGEVPDPVQGVGVDTSHVVGGAGGGT